MEIKITVILVDDQLSGFELGDFTIVHNEATISSAGRMPRQSMMIFIFLSDFLEKLRSLKRNRQRCKIIAADSSFTPPKMCKAALRAQAKNSR